ncbi:flagellar biosynthesis protein FlhF [Aquibacillus sp. 3ASR75-11]|uniref:Flagellar biosynthesis protein FlhF n=1 Tax=Terrihalobacillus insolitus TaxID=2950438 RepID=A0A9X3WPQ9_9BACI|nr:flagellar biosynthesis protein FlhF [Terrihalobacillus insolitus]MDC3414119.1 flagellar biosynthesis protein FlhF [Terrihalobacillus insolitus]MDC3423560.1 flagellar biosynthesis protein FlhF [Terrihalobacillus insolitus]
MKVKKIVAPTMTEAMKRVRKEFGADAVILNSKEIVEGGFLGFFKKRNIQLIAAMDPQPKRTETTNTIQKVSKPTKASQAVLNENNGDVVREIRELKKWIEKHTIQQNVIQYGDFDTIFKFLLEQEVNPEIAGKITKNVMQETLKHGQDSESQMRTALKQEIKKQLANCTFGGIRYDKKFVHLVGPTGVGKTTTIAKIAAESVLKDKKKVAFITTDTYRIAAIDQLKTYAKILDVPIEIAYNLEDYRNAKQRFKDYDLVLVDTAGRNFRDPLYVEELRNMFDFDKEFETYLVLSLTTKQSDLENIYSQFHNIPIGQLIFTKSDETSQYGSILNLCISHQVGISYITNGQDVPDDIKEIRVDSLSEMLVGDYQHE